MCTIFLYRYGFGRPNIEKGKPSRYHYYSLHNTQRVSGNKMHCFEAELAMIRGLARAGALRFCDASGCKMGPKVQSVSKRGGR